MLYCIEFTPESEEMSVDHVSFENTPTKEDIIKCVEDESMRKYDPIFDKLEWYEVKIKGGNEE